MSDAHNVAKSLRERLSGTTEERLGKALSDLLENPLLTGAIGRAFDAREKAVQAQEVAMGALNLPSASDIERLTRRLRSVSNRLEGIEDGVDRLDRARPAAASDNSELDQRLSAIEAQLTRLTETLGERSAPRGEAKASKATRRNKAASGVAKANTSAGKASAGNPSAGKAKSPAVKAKTSRSRSSKG